MNQILKIFVVVAMQFFTVVSANAQVLTCKGSRIILSLDLWNAGGTDRAIYGDLSAASITGANLHVTDFYYFDNMPVHPNDSVNKSHSHGFSLDSIQGCVIDLPENVISNFTTHLLFCGGQSETDNEGEVLSCTTR